MNHSNKRFKSRALRVLFHILPRRIKRMVLISSLAGKISGQKEMDLELRKRLQQKFGLCKDPDAVALPLALSEAIWGKRHINALLDSLETDHELTEQELTRLARQIVATMPCWLVYGKTMRIVEEVRTLIQTRDELFAHG
jgi:hypothetical protein